MVGFNVLLLEMKNIGWKVDNQGDIYKYKCYKGQAHLDIELYKINPIKEVKKKEIHIEEDDDFIYLIKVTNINENSKVVISRLYELIDDLIILADKFRLIIRFKAKKDEDFNNELLSKGFIRKMKTIYELDSYIYLDKSKNIITDFNDKWIEILEKYCSLFTDAGNNNEGIILDAEYKSIINKKSLTGKDFYIIKNYLTVAKKYYEEENTNYDNIYADEVSDLESILEILPV